MSYTRIKMALVLVQGLHQRLAKHVISRLQSCSQAGEIGWTKVLNGHFVLWFLISLGKCRESLRKP